MSSWSQVGEILYTIVVSLVLSRKETCLLGTKACFEVHLFSHIHMMEIGTYEKKAEIVDVCFVKWWQAYAVNPCLAQSAN